MALVTSNMKSLHILMTSQKLIGLHITTKIPIIVPTLNLLSTSSLVQNGTFEAPKRPKGAFFQFRDDALLKLDEQSKTKKQTDVSVILGEKWNLLPDEEKMVYRDRFLKEREEYKKKLADIMNDPNLKGKLELLQQEKIKKMADKAKRKARLEKNDLMKKLGRPKQPPNAYSLFVAEEMKKLKGTGKGAGFNIGSRAKLIGESWKLLNEDDKGRYIAQSEELKAQYDAVLEEWKRRMLEQEKFSDIADAQKKLNRKRENRRKLDK